MKKEIVIPESRMILVIDALTKFNKKAKKLGTTPFTVETRKTEKRDITVKHTTIKVTYLTIEISGEIPKIDGWNLIARTEHYKDGKNIIFKFNTTQDLEKYRNRIWCDHCKTNHYRKYTWILESDTGSKKQVGTSCIRDFIGHDPTKILGLIEYWNDFIHNISTDDSGFNLTNAGYETYCLPITEWVARTYHYIIKLGGFYVSKTKALEQDKESTASIIGNSIFGLPNNYSWEDVYDFDIKPDAEDYDKANEIINWVKTTEKDNDYWYTLKLLLESDTTKLKYDGYITSIIPTWVRETKKQKEIKKSNFVGTVKTRQEFTLTLKGIRGFEGTYGWTTIYMFEDKNGNQIKWFSSSGCYVDGKEIEINKTYHVVGTVKDHQDHPKYGKSTILTRCKIK